MDNDTTTQAPTPTSGDQALSAASQQVSQPHTALPAPTPHMPQYAEGAKGLLSMLTQHITNSYAEHKENKIRNAMGTYMTYANAHTRAEDMVNKSGVTDPAQRQQMMLKFVSADPSVVAIFSGKSGEKNVKAMKDLLKVDFTDPESMNTVQHQALKRVTKAIGAQKMMAMLGTLRGQHAQWSQQRGQQPGQTPGQQPGQQPGQLPGALGAGGQLSQPPTDPGARNVAARAESQATPIPTDVKGATDVAHAEAELTTSRANMVRAQMEYRDKYDIRPDAQGNIVAINKSDPTKTVRVTGEDGKPITGLSKVGAGEGKVAMVENVPYGITHAGLDGKPKVVTPTDPEWTAADAKVFEAARGAAAAGEANKMKLANQRATFFSSLPQAALAKRDIPERGIKAGELAFPSRAEASKDLTMWAPVAAGDKTMGAQARYGEIQATVDGTNAAIAKLPDTGFDADARAQLAYVMRDPHPSSALDSFMKSSAATTLSDPQIEYVQWLASLSESAQALVSLQGMGARSSDRMRAAVAAMLPGPGTPSKKYAMGQMGKLQIEINALKKGIPSLGALDTGGAPKDSISFTDAGTTYDIPKDKVGAFKKAHPNATTAR